MRMWGPAGGPSLKRSKLKACKTHILSKRETEKALEAKVGLENVEVGYGGQKPAGYAIADMEAYLDPAYVKGKDADQ